MDFSHTSHDTGSDSKYGPFGFISTVYTKLIGFRIRRTEFAKETRHFASWLESDAVENSNEIGQGTILIKLKSDGTAVVITTASNRNPDLLNEYKSLWRFLYSLHIRQFKLDTRLERNQIEDVIGLLYAYRAKLMKSPDSRIAKGPVANLLSENGLHIACTCTSIQNQTLAISYSYCTLVFSRFIRWFEKRHKNFHDHRALFYAAPRYTMVIGVIIIVPGVIYSYMLGNWQLFAISGLMALLLAGMAYMFFMVAGSVEYDNEEKEYQLNKAYKKLKNYNRACEQLADSLSEKNKELQDFTSIVCHDLANPLLSINGFAEMLDHYCQQLYQLMDKNDDSNELKNQVSDILKTDIPEALSFIRTNAVEMGKLLEGLKQVARIGYRTLQIESHDTNETVTQIVNKMKFQIGDCGASVVVEPLIACRGDAAQLNQLFRNLLNNALKYLDPQRKGQIRISSRSENGMSVYSIEDNGIGIAPRNKDRIFEIFYRTDPMGSVSGEGLGLTIVKRIIDRHNGKIWIESEPGKGSTFNVALPMP